MNNIKQTIEKNNAEFGAKSFSKIKDGEIVVIPDIMKIQLPINVIKHLGKDFISITRREDGKFIGKRFYKYIIATVRGEDEFDVKLKLISYKV